MWWNSLFFFSSFSFALRSLNQKLEEGGNLRMLCNCFALNFFFLNKWRILTCKWCTWLPLVLSWAHSFFPDEYHCLAVMIKLPFIHTAIHQSQWKNAKWFGGTDCNGIIKSIKNKKKLFMLFGFKRTTKLEKF